MKSFSPGTQVETTDAYYQTFGRKVIGIVLQMNPEPPENATIVRWLYQEGNVIPVHQDQAVLMSTKDLQEMLLH